MYLSIPFQQGKKVKKNQGFYGKGFKFDETEAQLAAERKKLQKAALGLQVSLDFCKILNTEPLCN